MPKQNFPPAVTYFGHKGKSDRGKFHPKEISPGVETTQKIGGSPNKVSKDFSAKARSVVPKGVTRGDGTEPRKGTKTTHLQKTPGFSRPGASSKNLPSGVGGGDGLKAPKRVK